MPSDLLSIAEVRSKILATVPRLASETVGLADLAGRVLAEPVRATEDVPGWDNSGMDGYAVRADDVATAGAVLDVIGDIPAGGVATGSVGPGQAFKIMTGAPMPDGADTVVRVEDTSETEGRVTIRQAYERGTYVRPRGGDVPAGDVVIPEGTRLGPQHVGMMAALGVVEAIVSRRPRVAVLSTGDELRPAETPVLEPGTIRDSNRPMLMGLVEAAGGEVIDMGSVADDDDLLRAVIGRAVAEADVIISSGGVSMGDYDVVKAVLGGEAGVEFLSLAMNPGKPLGFGMVGGRPFFGLPGNPVSVLVSFEQFARPALLAMQGANALLRPRVRGVAGETFTSDPAKEAFLRARIVDHATLEVVSTGGQGSNVLSGAAAADCFAVMPVGVDKVEPGDSLLLELFTAQENRGVGDE
ncbi:MAG: molybdopterin molybdotransferase MoeA [Acidimicrobiales bacterium]|nr:molybdopterin molybdotransferase MoeA [Acidimicrobiales bacterium]